MDFAGLRERMVRRQIAARGLIDPALLAAFRTVPREMFVPLPLRPYAYDDNALPIEAGQTISQPYVVARMIDAALLQPGDHVLEVGAGSGYAAAVMSQLVSSVVSIERQPNLAQVARERMARLGYANVDVIHGDGIEGLSARAPYDAILCAAASPQIPSSWIDQLAPGGRIVMPRGEHDGTQQLVRLTLGSDAQLQEEWLDLVRFVPLVQGIA